MLCKHRTKCCIKHYQDVILLRCRRKWNSDKLNPPPPPAILNHCITTNHYITANPGAVYILRNAQDIDFNVLYSGRVCLDEVNRIKRLARMDCVRFPKFLKHGCLGLLIEG